eukprot:SAG11_NODE_129_length_15500_cov_16.145250_17_plen_61_part_00
MDFALFVLQTTKPIAAPLGLRVSLRGTGVFLWHRAARAAFSGVLGSAGNRLPWKIQLGGP